MTKEKITEICRELDLYNYHVNEDGTVDVDGTVVIYNKKITQIPINFGVVGGDFFIKDTFITSLKGAPRIVGGDFVCSDNHLVSLIGGPQEVGGYYNCVNNHLVTLEGAPKIIKKDFQCYVNQLRTLEGAPDEVHGEFFAYENALRTLSGGPKKVEGNFCVAGNRLRDLVGCPEFVGGNFHFDDTLTSTYSGYTNCRIAGKVKICAQNEITRNKLPIEIIENATHLHYVLKYQQYYEVWNEDMSLNKSNFEDIIEDIVDGLQ